MARRYFNGVKKLSFNGNQFSFEFEDKYQTGNGELISDGVVTLVTELDKAEDIFKYLLSEIDKIKKLMPDNNQHEHEYEHNANVERDNEKKRSASKLGKKIEVAGFEHN